MAIEAGQQLLHYRLIEKIGEGGMGVVWKALDTNLGREVAIKFLPEAFAADSERLSRFEREARLLASLNHANIATIHGIEQVEKTRLLVMELVEGEDLAQRLERGRLAVEDALELARQVAEALEEAHERGIIHRDLKPANIKVTSNGRVKVLDFGLAKALDTKSSASGSTPSMSPTVTSLGTLAGTLLGTAAYMSPEQAKGKPVDRRADIWAFGVVLFETLAGQRLFHRESVSETLAAVLMAEPDFANLPAELPRSLRRLLERCLERDPRKRLRDIGEARIAIERLQAGGDDDERAAVAAADRTATRRWWPALVGLLVGALVGGLALRDWSQGSTGPPVSYLSVPLDPTNGLLFGTASGTGSFELSPDGRVLAAIAHPPDGGFRCLFVRHLDRSTGFIVPETNRAAAPFFSPDGQTIGFFSGGSIRSVAIDGGGVDVLFDGDELPGDPNASWHEQLGIVIAGTRSSDGKPGLWKIDPRLRRLEELYVDEEAEDRSIFEWPDVLPDGRGVLFTHLVDGRLDKSSVELLTTADGQVTSLLRGFRGSYAPGGYLVLSRGGDLLAAPFDQRRRELVGPLQTVMQGLAYDLVNGEAKFSISPAGTLAYIPEDATLTDRDNLLWVDTEGSSRSSGAPPRMYTDLRISPEGSRVAFSLPTGDNDIWIYEFERQTQTRLTFAIGEDETPVWSPDGQWLAYSSSRDGEQRTIRRRRVDGSGEEQLIWQGEEHIHVSGWTPDGKTLLVDARSESGSWDVWAIDVEGDGQPRVLLGNPYAELLARLSPDGRWLAYVSSETSRPEVYVQRYPQLDRKIQISHDGGAEPVWSRDGRRLYYRFGSRVMSAVVRPGAEPLFSKAGLLFEADYGTGKAFTHFSYDVAADGRLLMTLEDSASFPRSISLVLGWERLLAERFER